MYLPVSAKTSHENPTAQLSLLLFIKNEASLAVHLNKVTLAFTGPPIVADVSIDTTLYIWPGGTSIWNFIKDQNVILPWPTPSSLQLSLFFGGNSTPWTVTKPLAAHQSPVPKGSYLFPARFTDLGPGEYWEGSSGHGEGYQGNQLFAYDMGVTAFDFTINYWTTVRPNTSGGKNEHIRIWDKPIYAMADGSVLYFENKVPDNPHPLEWQNLEELNEKMEEQKNDYWGDFERGVAGNHFFIQHGDEVVLYAHMQTGTLSKHLLNLGAAVKTGERLGLAGNSGNSISPHLHVHSIKGNQLDHGPLRPLSFHNIQVIDRTFLNPPDPNGPWVEVDGQGLPAVPTAILPQPRLTRFPLPGWQQWPDRWWTWPVFS